jgi:CHAT domain-containing protein
MARRSRSNFEIGKALRHIIALVVTFLFTALHASGLLQSPSSFGQAAAPANQEESTALELGKPIERELAAGQKHAYQVALSEGQFMRVEIRDLGTDVGVWTYSPSGEAMNPWQPVGEPFDVKPVSWVAGSTGFYRIQVYVSSKAAAGRYEIRLTELRPANENDRALQEARQFFREYVRLHDQGRYAEATSSIRRALEIREKVLGPDNILVATTLGFLANDYNNIGDYASAESADLRSLKIKEKLLGSDHPDVAHELFSLSMTYRNRGDSAKAEEAQLRAIAILEKFHKSESATAAAILDGLADIHYERQDYQGAEAYSEKARGIWEKLLGANHFHIASSFTFLGRVAYDRGDYTRAEEMFQRALTLSEAALGQENLRVTRYRNDLARLYCTTGDYPKGEAIYRHVLALHEQKAAMSHPAVQDSLFGLARCYAAQGNASEALKLQSQASEIEERYIAVNLSVGSEREKQAFLATLSSRSSRNISLHLQLAPHDPIALNLAVTTLLQSKGRVQDAMSASLSALRQRFSQDDQKRLDQLGDVTSRLASLVLNGPQKMPVTEYQQRTTALEEQRDGLEEEMNRRSAGFYAASKPVTLAAVQAAIPADAALIEFAVYRPFDPRSPNDQKQSGKPHYVAYVVRSQGEVQWSELGEADAIDSAIDNLRRALRDPRRKDVKKLARAVDKLVMQPLYLPAGDAVHLLISPDGKLNLIPFEALVDRQGRYLAKNYLISYLTAGRDLLRMQVMRESKSSPVVIADPVFGEPDVVQIAAVSGRVKLVSSTGKRGVTSGDDPMSIYFAPLRGTREEAHVIHSLFPDSQVFTGAHATKSALTHVSAPRILHIATHGFFLEGQSGAESPGSETGKQRSVSVKRRIENPLLRSGLALTGANLTRGRGGEGILTALEASTLNLWGTKLVTLSACETGVGEVKDGEGVYGLRRSFFLAGSEALVMSLWSVSDQVTREMMTAYYTGLKQGSGRGEALHRAELAMMKRKGREHPFYWASFIQSGDWRSLNGRN